MKNAFDFHSRPVDGHFFRGSEQFLPDLGRENLSFTGSNRQKTQKFGGFRTILNNRAEVLTVAQPLLGGY